MTSPGQNLKYFHRTVPYNALNKNCLNGSAPSNKMAPRAVDEMFLMTPPPELQNNFTQMFLMRPSSKIA